MHSELSHNQGYSDIIMFVDEVIWRFPEIGLPPIHPCDFFWMFPNQNQAAIGVLHMETPIWNRDVCGLNISIPMTDPCMYAIFVDPHLPSRNTPVMFAFFYHTYGSVMGLLAMWALESNDPPLGATQRKTIQSWFSTMACCINIRLV